MKTILKHKKKIILILIFLIILISLIGLKLSIDSRNSKKITIETKEELLKEKTEIKTEDIVEEVVETKVLYYVDVKGAVANPGVYALEEGQRVNDAITLAGGLTENGDTSLINLAKTIWDEMVIIVYTKDEVIRSNTKFELNTKINNAYNSGNNASINNTSSSTTTNSTTSSDTSSESSNKTSNTNESESTSTTVNINTASLEELMTLSGIGESKAQAIIDYREENGNFSSIEDIMNVSGIGQKAYEKIKEYITV